MNSEELKAQVTSELDNIQKVLDELDPLTELLNSESCSNRDKAAAATFLSQCYMGIENILKRILIFCDESIPSGQDWHINLVRQFRENRTAESNVPRLLDDDLYNEITGLRRLRHVVMHSYGFTLDRAVLSESAARTDRLFEGFMRRIQLYLDSLP